MNDALVLGTAYFPSVLGKCQESVHRFRFLCAKRDT